MAGWLQILIALNDFFSRSFTQQKIAFRQRLLH